jgi:hypothetical protein
MTNNTVIPRYPRTYRQDELRLICEYARAGKSLCFVGVAGVGKSNMTNFLRFDPYHYKQNYLQDTTETLLFPWIDGNAWDQSAQGLWEMMLDDLKQLTRDLPSPPSDPKIVQLPFMALRARIEWLTREQNRQIMFILDDFDKVLQSGPLSLLEQFSTLRQAGNRNRLCYLIFTKKLPAVLGRCHPLTGNSQFYNLFKNDIYALEPYRHDDTMQMLNFLNENASKPLRTKDLVVIGEKLSGGHAGLVKVVFELWRRQAPDPEQSEAYILAAKPEVRNECQRIFEQLHPREQKEAKLLVQGKTTDPKIIDLLVRRGLLVEGDRLEWFSPLMREYLKRDGGRE